MTATLNTPASGELDQPAPPRTPAPSAALAHSFRPSWFATYVPISGLSTHHRPYFLSSFPHRPCNACGIRYVISQRNRRSRRKGLGGTAADNYSSPEAAQVPQPQVEQVERSCHAAPPDAPHRQTSMHSATEQSVICSALMNNRQCRVLPIAFYVLLVVVTGQPGLCILESYSFQGGESAPVTTRTTSATLHGQMGLLEY
jgi:hypothetical protein